MMPAVSIVIPSYNYAHTLPLTIESVLKQSFSDFELLIMDDASTDSSLDVAKDYAKKDHRISVFCHKQNQGIAKMVNEAAKRACGTYMHVLSADDFYLPGFLEKQMSLFYKYPEMGICACDFGYFFENSLENILTTVLINGTKQPIYFDKNRIGQVFKKTYFWIPGHTSIYRRDSFCKYGGYQEHFGPHMDWLINHQIALFEGAGYIPETLTAMRLHPNSFSSSTSKEKLKFAKRNMLDFLLDGQNKELAKRFKKSTLLHFLFKALGTECLIRPKTWSFYPPLIYKYLRNKLQPIS